MNGLCIPQQCKASVALMSQYLQAAREAEPPRIGHCLRKAGLISSDKKFVRNSLPDNHLWFAFSRFLPSQPPDIFALSLNYRSISACKGEKRIYGAKKL